MSQISQEQLDEIKASQDAIKAKQKLIVMKENGQYLIGPVAGSIAGFGIAKFIAAQMGKQVPWWGYVLSIAIGTAIGDHIQWKMTTGSVAPASATTKQTGKMEE